MVCTAVNLLFKSSVAQGTGGNQAHKVSTYLFQKQSNFDARSTIKLYANVGSFSTNNAS